MFYKSYSFTEEIKNRFLFKILGLIYRTNFQKKYQARSNSEEIL